MPLPSPKNIEVPEVLQEYTKQKFILKPKDLKHLSFGENIIKKARHTAKEIIEEAHKKEKEILLLAEQKHKEGFAVGSEEGKQHAIQEGIQWLIKANEIKASILDNVKDQMLETLESTLQSIFQETPSKLIKQQLEKALSNIESKEKVKIYASKKYETSITEVISKAKHKEIDIEVIYNPKDNDKCRLCTRYFEVEFSASTLKKNIIKAFRKAFGKPETEESEPEEIETAEAEPEKAADEEEKIENTVAEVTEEIATAEAEPEKAADEEEKIENTAAEITEETATADEEEKTEKVAAKVTEETATAEVEPEKAADKEEKTEKVAAKVTEETESEEITTAEVKTTGETDPN